MLNTVGAYLWKLVSYIMGRFIRGPVSQLYRKLFQSQHQDLPTNIPWTSMQLLSFRKKYLNLQPHKRFCISKPEKLYELKQGSCDDFAAFASQCIKWPSCLLYVTWFDPSASGLKKFQQTIVCVYYYKYKWYYIGDQGRYGPFSRPKDVWNSLSPDDTVPCTYGIMSNTKLRWFAGGFLKLKRKVPSVRRTKQ